MLSHSLAEHTWKFVLRTLSQHRINITLQIAALCFGAQKMDFYVSRWQN
jgi:hypothetical protein